MRINVGISDLKFSHDPDDVLVTHGLGSCIAVAAYDPILKHGALLHYMLPIVGDRPRNQDFNPMMFGDTGMELMMQYFDLNGCKRNHIRFVIAGGASLSTSSEKVDHFEIGKRNITTAKKFFWKNNLLISAEHTGDSISRTLYLEMNTGETYITTQGTKIAL